MQRVQFLSYGPNQWNCARAQLTISLTGMKVTTEQHNNKSKSLFNKILTFVLTYQLLLSQNARMNACTHARTEKNTHTPRQVCAGRKVWGAPLFRFKNQHQEFTSQLLHCFLEKGCVFF